MRFLALIAILLLTALPSSAGIINVPGNAATIQDGINLAKYGDTIIVADGTYSGNGNWNLQFSGKFVLLKSQNGPATTIIDMAYTGTGGARRAFNLLSYENQGLVIDGFTLRGGGGYEWGGAIYVSESSPTFKNCLIIDNFAPQGGGVYATGECSPKFYNCEFRENSCTNVGAAVLVRAGATGYFENCIIEDNFGAHGAFLCWNASPVVVDCIFMNNNMNGHGGAVFMQDNCSPSFTGCTFARNNGGVGGAIYIQERGAVGGHSFPVFTGCTIYGNLSRLGGAVYCDGYGGPTRPEFARCLITFNQNDEALNIRRGEPQLFCTDIFGNPMGDWTGEIAGQATVAGNFSLDPLFCDTTGDNFNIDAGSPAASLNNECGQLIGAWPVGCAVTTIMAHLFVEPDPLLQVYETSFEPMNITLYCGSMDHACDPHLIDTASVTINGQKVSMISQVETTNQDYWGDILMVTCPAPQFLGLYDFLWDTTTQAIVVQANMTDGMIARFEGRGTFIGRLTGDANADRAINIGDPVFLLKFLFNDGRPPDPLLAGDANGDDLTNIGDAVYLINYIFKDGPRPVSISQR